MERLEDMATFIGDYNDERIHFEHLNSFSSPDTQIPEENAIKKICKKEETKLAKEKKKILGIINEFSAAQTPATSKKT
jgi:hypothetical protein